MNRDYLIIWCVPYEGESHAFLETEEQLLNSIDDLKNGNNEIIFAGKIAVVKEFIG